MQNSEPERFICLKFQKPSKISDPKVHDKILESLSNILQNVAQISGIELVIRIPKNDKKLFWQISQNLRKLKSQIPDVEYLDSQKKLPDMSESFISDQSQIPEELKDGTNEILDKKNSDGVESYSQLSQILSSIVQKQEEDDGEILPDFNLSEVLSQPLPLERKVFELEVKEFARFQAFVLMIKNEKTERGTFFPGIDKTLKIHLECRKGDFNQGISNKVVAFSTNASYSKKDADYDRQAVKNYISMLVFEKVDISHFDVGHQKSILNLVKEVLSKEDPNLRFMNNVVAGGKLLFAGYTSRSNLQQICKKLLEMRNFNGRTVMKSPSHLNETSQIEEIVAYYKLIFVADTREIINRLHQLARSHFIRSLEVNKRQMSFSTELKFSYISCPADEHRFRIEYEQMMAELSVFKIPEIHERIYEFTEETLLKIRSKAEKESFRSINITKVYITPFIKRRNRSIVIIGDKKAEVEGVGEEILEVLKRFSMKTFDPGDKPKFQFFQKHIAAMRGLLPVQFDSFKLEEDADGLVFRTFGPSELHDRYHGELKTFIHERYFEECNILEFKDRLVWVEVYKYLRNQTFAGMEGRSTALNLTEKLTIYIQWDRISCDKPVLCFGCYHKNKEEAFRFFHEKITEYEKEIIKSTVLLPKDLFQSLRKSEKNEVLSPESSAAFIKNNKMSANFQPTQKTLKSHQNFEDIAYKAQVEFVFSENSLISGFSQHHLHGCFQIGNMMTIALFHGVCAEFNSSKRAHIFPIDYQNGTILTDSFPQIRRERFAAFSSEFKAHNEKNPIYTLKTKPKQLKSKEIRVFLSPIHNPNDPENYFDYFQTFTIRSGVLALLERFESEEKPPETLIVNLGSPMSKYLENFPEEMLKLLSEIKSTKVKTIVLIDASFDRMEKLYLFLKEEERNEKEKEGKQDFKWFGLEEGKQVEWTAFPNKMSEEIETAFRVYQKNKKKSMFYILQESNAEGVHLTIKLSIKNQRVSLIQLGRNMELKSFFAEAKENELGFANKEKIIQNFKDLNMDEFLFYAYADKIEFLGDIDKLKNNTAVSFIDFIERAITRKDHAKKPLPKILIKKDSIIKRMSKQIGANWSKNNQSRINSGIDQLLGLKEKIEFEGEKVKIVIRGMEDHIKHAKLELEKVVGKKERDSGCLPIDWEPFLQKHDYLLRYELGRSAKWQEIKQKIERTVKTPILNIERLQNMDLYSLFSEEILKSGSSLSTRYLFFGSEAINPEKLFSSRTESLDPKDMPNNVLEFFKEAEDAFKKGFRSKKGEIIIFFAEVFTGKSYLLKEGEKWNEAEKKAPLEIGSKVSRMDSVEEKKLIRIFEKNRAYPEYLITFHSENTM